MHMKRLKIQADSKRNPFVVKENLLYKKKNPQNQNKTMKYNQIRK